MANVVQMSEWMKSGPTTKLAAQPIESLSEGIEASYAILGYRGKNLTLRYRKEEKPFVQVVEGRTQNRQYIDAIILRQNKNKSKTYYASYEEGAKGARPLCSSVDGIVPDVGVSMKQSDVCALCPQNQRKIKPNGKPGKACTDYKRLAIFILPELTAGMFGEQPLMEPVFMRVPPGSLIGLASFGATMAARGWPFNSFITRISFDQDEAYPKFVFEAVGKVDEAQEDYILELSQDQLAKRITGEDMADRRANPLLTTLHHSVMLEREASMGSQPKLIEATVEPEAPSTSQHSDLDARIAGLMKLPPRKR